MVDGGYLLLGLCRPWLALSMSMGVLEWGLLSFGLCDGGRCDVEMLSINDEWSWELGV